MSSSQEKIEASICAPKTNSSSVKEWNSKTDMTHSKRSELSRSSTWQDQNERFLQNPFGQSSLYQNSMVVCFVCGNLALEENMSKLHSRNSHTHTDSPFFPFLEYHDPAPGADPMKEDWSVVGCSVCNCLLSQQWKSFERTRMPINKRLYWLKRPSGCEIRQPVSQIELEEILSEHSKENFAERDECNSDDSLQLPLKRPRTASPNPNSAPETEADDKSQSVTAFVCYSCGKKDSMPCSIFPVHCKPSYEQMRAGVPYYPSILNKKSAPGSTLLYGSIAFLCMSCLPKFETQWHLMQQRFLEEDITKMALPRIPLPELVSCYLCGSEVSTKLNDCIVHTHSASGSENSHHRKLITRKQLNGSVPLTFGFTYVCMDCRPFVSNNDGKTDATSDCEKQ